MEANSYIYIIDIIDVTHLPEFTGTFCTWGSVVSVLNNAKVSMLLNFITPMSEFAKLGDEPLPE